MDDDCYNMMYRFSILPHFSYNANNISDKASTMVDIVKTWRRIKPEGCIGDEQIKKLEDLKKNVFHACRELKNKISDNMENFPVDLEQINKLFDEIRKLSSNMNHEFKVFKEYYKGLSKIFFNEEYDM